MYKNYYSIVGVYKFLKKKNVILLVSKNLLLRFFSCEKKVGKAKESVIFVVNIIKELLRKTSKNFNFK